MPGWTAEDLAGHYRRLREPTPDLTKDEAPPSAPLAPKGRKPRQKLEEQVQRQIIDLLEAHQWLVMRTNKFCGRAIASQGAIEPGMPDIQARKPAEWRDGPVKRAANGAYLWEIIWIEVKKPGGKVSTVQATWHQLARKRGETVLIAEAVEEVAAAIGVKL